MVNMSCPLPHKTLLFYFPWSVFFLISHWQGYEADEDSPLVVYGPTFLFMAINSIVPISIYKVRHSHISFK